MRLALCATTATALALALAAEAAAVPPAASFSMSPGSPLTLEPVKFTSTSTGTINSFAWDLDGDGALDDGTASSVTRSFAMPGVYVVRLHVEGPEGSGEQTRNVSVGNRGPTAQMSWVPAAPVAGQPVTLVSTSQDPDGRVVDELWDLDGDGAFDDATGPSVMWSFPTDGPHVVRLRTKDDRGAEATAETTVQVAPRVFPLLGPFPTVRLTGTVGSTGTLVKRLVITAPPGTVVVVRCAGRGCRRDSQTVAVGSRTLRFRKFEARLRPRSALRVYVTKPDTFGKYVRFWFRRDRSPARRDLCLAPNTRKPVDCPDG